MAACGGGGAPAWSDVGEVTYGSCAARGGGSTVADSRLPGRGGNAVRPSATRARVARPARRTPGTGSRRHLRWRPTQPDSLLPGRNNWPGAECAAAVRGGLPIPGRWTGVHPVARRPLLVMLPPLVTLALVFWHGALFLRRSVATADPALQATLQAFRPTSCRRWRTPLTGKKDAADRRVAEELAQKCRRAAAPRPPWPPDANPTPTPEAARREALRELSDLQNRLKRLAADAGPSPQRSWPPWPPRSSEKAPKRPARPPRRCGNGVMAARRRGGWRSFWRRSRKSADPAAALDRLARAMQEQAGKLSEAGARRTRPGRWRQARAEAEAKGRFAERRSPTSCAKAGRERRQPDRPRPTRAAAGRGKSGGATGRRAADPVPAPAGCPTNSFNPCSTRWKT